MDIDWEAWLDAVLWYAGVLLRLLLLSIPLWAIFGFVCLLKGCTAPGRDEQMIIHYLDGDEVLNGPKNTVVSPFRDRTSRPQVRLNGREYARIENRLTGDVRTVAGSKTFFMEAYEDLKHKGPKFLLKNYEYRRFYNQLDGTERIIGGTSPASFTPGPWEIAGDTVEQSPYINVESAAIVFNAATGERTIEESNQGGNRRWVPNPYERLVETRSLQRVLSQEALIVRDIHGGFQFKDGSKGAKQFFLKPEEALVEVEWSTFSEPQEGGFQVIGKETLTRIELRERRLFFQYNIRTADNVALQVEGNIWWKVQDIETCIPATADPPGDVWYRGRNVVVATVSKYQLRNFTKKASIILKAAYQDQLDDGFYSDRGIAVVRLSLTKYLIKDGETDLILQQINEEMTKRQNRLNAQRAADTAALNQLKAEIKLEEQRTTLIQTARDNDILVAQKANEAIGTQVAFAASTFLDGLEEQGTITNPADRVSLYEYQKGLEHAENRTATLSTQRTTFFLTPDHLGLDLQTADFQVS